MPVFQVTPRLSSFDSKLFELAATRMQLSKQQKRNLHAEFLVLSKVWATYPKSPRLLNCKLAEALVALAKGIGAKQLTGVAGLLFLRRSWMSRYTFIASDL